MHLHMHITGVLSSLCSGSGGHLHSGVVHRDYVRCGVDRSHPPHSLLYQEEPRGEISRYICALTLSRRSTAVAQTSEQCSLSSTGEKRGSPGAGG